MRIIVLFLIPLILISCKPSEDEEGISYADSTDSTSTDSDSSTSTIEGDNSLAWDETNWDEVNWQ